MIEEDPQERQRAQNGRADHPLKAGERDAVANLANAAKWTAEMY